MNEVQLFAVTPAGPVPLHVPRAATDVHELFDPMPLGVYSGLATYGHDKFVRLDEHIARTERSAARMRWRRTLDRTELRRVLHELVVAFPYEDCRVRFDVLRVPLRRDGFRSSLIIGLSRRLPVPERDLTEGVTLALTPIRRRDPLTKTTDFVIERRVCVEQAPAAYEHLMADEQRRILEGTSVNFFGVRDGVLLTAGTGVLEGITRKTVLELAPELGIEVSLRGVSVDELSTLDEAFVTSSTRELVPVIEVSGITIGRGRPGAMTMRLLEAYRSYVKLYARPAWPIAAGDV